MVSKAPTRESLEKASDLLRSRVSALRKDSGKSDESDSK
jgi:hypothetical protein